MRRRVWLTKVWKGYHVREDGYTPAGIALSTLPLPSSDPPHYYFPQIHGLHHTAAHFPNVSPSFLIHTPTHSRLPHTCTLPFFKHKSAFTILSSILILKIINRFKFLHLNSKPENSYQFNFHTNNFIYQFSLKFLWMYGFKS